jgi:hypothetical protein
MDELMSLNGVIDRKQEVMDMKLEAIAAVFNVPARAKIKKHRQMHMILHDHQTQRHVIEQRDALADEMWNRTRKRALRVTNNFAQTHRILAHIGELLGGQAQSLLKQSEQRWQTRKAEDAVGWVVCCECDVIMVEHCSHSRCSLFQIYFHSINPLFNFCNNSRSIIIILGVC